MTPNWVLVWDPADIEINKSWSEDVVVSESETKVEFEPQMTLFWLILLNVYNILCKYNTDIDSHRNTMCCDRGKV